MADMTVSEDALARHEREMRRQSRIYAAVVGVIVVAAAVIAELVWIHGEAHNTTLHTVASPPPAVAMQSPNATLTQAWRTTDELAAGVPVAGGTVITYTKHTVRGRDARTGKVTWSYSRSNRVLCNAAQAAGIVVALYKVNGNCDEVTGLKAETGARKWVRTLDMDG